MYRFIWWFSVLSIVTAICIGYLILPTLPALMPSHWNSAGVVDGWQTAYAYIWFLPALTLGFVAILGIMSARMTDVRVRPYIALSAGLFTVYMVGLHVLIGMRALAGQILLMTEFMRLLGGLFIGLACIIKNVPPNHVVGFRFPWTMRDVDTWARTHVVGFWGMMLSGVCCLLITVLPLSNNDVVVLGMSAILVGITIPSIYSYWYWRTKRSQ